MISSVEQDLNMTLITSGTSDNSKTHIEFTQLMGL